MKDAHSQMKITDADFNVIAEILISVLKDLGVD